MHLTLPAFWMQYFLDIFSNVFIKMEHLGETDAVCIWPFQFLGAILLKCVHLKCISQMFFVKYIYQNVTCVWGLVMQYASVLPTLCLPWRAPYCKMGMWISFFKFSSVFFYCISQNKPQMYFLKCISQKVGASDAVCIWPPHVLPPLASPSSQASIYQHHHFSSLYINLYTSALQRWIHQQHCSSLNEKLQIRFY